MKGWTNKKGSERETFLRDLIIFIGNLNAVREQEKLAGMKGTD